MQIEVSTSVIPLTRKVEKNSRIDLDAEILSSRLVVEVKCKLATIQSSWAARLNLALISN